MITLGITGRSGCGKSSVTACFRERGVPVADADQISREILLPGSPILERLVLRFGADILDEQGALRRRLLADRAFASPEGKASLDAITHPEIIRRIRKEKQAALLAGHSLFAVDGAVLIGTVAEAECDRILVVTAPYEASVARIVHRDGISPEMARRRLDAQTPERELAVRADYLLCNDQTLEQLRIATFRLMDMLIKECAAREGGFVGKREKMD